MNTFPPNDLHCFLKLNVGHWLALRSQLCAATETSSQETLPPPVGEADISPSWHQADRGELRVAWLEPTQQQDCGGLTITTPDGTCQQVFFRWDGTILMNEELSGRWKLSEDGCLELEIREEYRIIKERIWFSKPNLRLRSTLEQFPDGRPGRASFSSEIRRVSPPQEAS